MVIYRKTVLTNSWTHILLPSVAVIAFLTVIMILMTYLYGNDRHSYEPKNGFIPDATTAIRVAEAVLSSVYGQTKIEGERPFKAVLKKDVWIVEGSLPSGAVGGVAVVEISKRDGRVLRMSHGK